MAACREGRILVDCYCRIGSKYRAAIGGRSEAREGGPVNPMATTSNDAVPVEDKQDATDVAVTVH